MDVWDLSDWFLLASLDVIWTFFPFSVFRLQAEIVHEPSLDLSLLAEPRVLIMGSFQARSELLAMQLL